MPVRGSLEGRQVAETPRVDAWPTLLQGCTSPVMPKKSTFVQLTRVRHTATTDIFVVASQAFHIFIEQYTHSTRPVTWPDRCLRRVVNTAEL